MEEIGKNIKKNEVSKKILPNPLANNILNDHSHLFKKYIKELNSQELVPQSLENLHNLFENINDIKTSWLQKLIPILNKIKNTYPEHLSIISSIEQILSKKNSKKSYYYRYIFEKFKVCNDYEKSIHYLDKIFQMNISNMELLEMIKLKINTFESKNITKLYLFHNQLLYKLKKKTSLEKILITTHPNIYQYIYLSENKDTDIIDSNVALSWVKKLGFQKKENKEIDQLKLKRGFLTCISKNNKEYILKYQPNKSFFEIVIHNYLYPQSLKYSLSPLFFYLNSDQSYFSVIEKYDCDLYKYFVILEKNKKMFYFQTLCKIIYTILKAVQELHKYNIIHTDLKPENTVIKLNESLEITELKIIDFDISLFDNIPKEFGQTYLPFKKLFLNKKNRGTPSYMKECDTVSHHNDVYSIGMIGIILLYKIVKMMISNYRLYSNIFDNQTNYIIKIKKIHKKIVDLRKKITEENNKILLLKTCIEFFKKSKMLKMDKYIFCDNDSKLNLFNDFLSDCVLKTFSIDQLLQKYQENIFKF